jgi:hypothetical protein
MNGQKFVVVAVVVLVALAGGVGALVIGLGPAPGGESGESVESFPAAGTDSGSGTDGGGSGSGDAGGTDGSETNGSDGSSDSVPAFSLLVERIEQCGQTCRDVTVSLTNEQNRTAENVTVYTRIYAGNSTAEEDRVWAGKQAVGAMEPGATFTGTERVQLSYREGYAVEQADGWITVLTTVQSDDTTLTFRERRDVA